MRRLRIPVKTSAMAVLILAGAAYVAAEARQAILRRQELELAEVENPAAAVQPSSSAQSSAVSPQRGLSSSTQRPALAAVGGDTFSARTQAALPKELKPATSQQHHIREIVISIPDRGLALLEDGQPVKFYPIAVGTRWTPSPEGEYQIINHAKDPTYRHNGKEIAPGKDNPLGDRWMGLSLKGYGIHGTNMPRSIGKAASHGCFRMAKVDVEDLYSRVQVGDAVSIHGRRDELVAKVFGPASSGPDAIASKTEIAATTKSNDAQMTSAPGSSPAMDAQE